jgi:hypothetical protein
MNNQFDPNGSDYQGDTKPMVGVLLIGAVALVLWIVGCSIGFCGQSIVIADGIADDTIALQSTIDQAIASGARQVVLPDGNIRITDTIHLGRGDAFASVSLVGSMSRPSVHVYGTFLRPTFSDRPVINVQGARHIELSGFGIVGPSKAPKTLARYADWVAAFPDDRNKQFAGISVDAFSGTDPGNGYSAPIGSWSKNHSSDVIIRGVSFQNLSCGVITKPSGGIGADNNGDYVQVVDCYATRCKHAWSINGSQTRHNTMSGCKVIDCYSAVAIGYYGAKVGRSVWVKDSKIEGCNWIVTSNCTDWLGQVSVENVSGEGTSGCLDLSNAGGNCVVTVRGCDLQLLDGDDSKVEERVWVRAPGSALTIENNRVISNGKTKPTLLIEGGRINRIFGNVFQSKSSDPKYLLIADKMAKLGPNLIGDQDELQPVGKFVNPLLFNAVSDSGNIVGLSPSVLHSNAKEGDVIATKYGDTFVLFRVVKSSSQPFGKWTITQLARTSIDLAKLSQASVNYIMRPTK